MKNRSLLPLIVSSLVLLLLAIVDPWTVVHTPALGRVLPASLSAELTRLQVSGVGRELTVEKAASGQWQFTNSGSTQVDSRQVERALSALQVLVPHREEVGAPYKELESPVATVAIAGERGPLLRLEFGALSGDGRLRWLRRRLPGEETGRRVLVEEHLVQEFLTASQAWTSKKVLAWRSGFATSLEFSSGEEWTKMDATELQWKPDGKLLSARSDSEKFRESVEYLRSLSFETELHESCSEDSPQLHVRWAENGATIRDCGKCTETLRHLQVGDRGGCVEGKKWQELSKILHEPSLFASQAVLPSDFFHQRFEVHCQDRVQQVDPIEVDQQELRTWADSLHELVGELQEVQPFTPRCVLRGENWELAIGVSGEEWVSQRANEKIQRKLGAEVEALLHIDRFLFPSLEFVSESSLFAKTIKVTVGGKTQRFFRGEILGSWSSEGMGGLRATEIALPLIRTLSHLRAESIEGGGALSAKNAYLVEIQFEKQVSGELRGISILLEGSASACKAQLSGGPVGTLSAETCRALLLPIGDLLGH